MSWWKRQWRRAYKAYLRRRVHNLTLYVFRYRNQLDEPIVREANFERQRLHAKLLKLEARQ